MAIAPISGFSAFKLGGVTAPSPSSPSAIGDMGGLGTSGVSGAAGSDSSGGFAGLVKRGLEQVSQAELKADSLLNTMASGGSVQPHEVMIATSQASLAVEMTVAVRDKAVEAYREIMNMQL